MDASKRQWHILTTLRYFDAMNRSLTAVEVWRWRLDAGKIFGDVISNRNERITFRETFDELDALVRRGLVSFRDGWYFLTASTHQFEKRNRTVKASNEKLRRMAYWVRVFQYIPFVRSLIATGGLATKTSGEESDWDVLIVVKSNRIWIARTMTTVIMHITGKRRHGHIERDRFCLNHFITDDFLEMEPRDIFSAKECVVAVPLCNHELFLQFWKRNLWLRSFLPQWEISRARHIRTGQKNRFGEIFQSTLELFLDWDWLEYWLESWQKPKIARNPKTSRKNSYIIISKQSLIFWPSPNGPKVFAKFKKNGS